MRIAILAFIITLLLGSIGLGLQAYLRPAISNEGLQAQIDLAKIRIGEWQQAPLLPLLAESVKKTYRLTQWCHVSVTHETADDAKKIYTELPAAWHASLRGRSDDVFTCLSELQKLMPVIVGEISIDNHVGIIRFSIMGRERT